MTVYSVPAMSWANEFVDLEFLAGYIDGLIRTTGDADYGMVCEWDEDGPESGRPPVGVLLRLNGAWERRHVLVTTRLDRQGQVHHTWSVGERVNGH